MKACRRESRETAAVRRKADEGNLVSMKRVIDCSAGASGSGPHFHNVKMSRVRSPIQERRISHRNRVLQVVQANRLSAGCKYIL